MGLQGHNYNAMLNEHLAFDLLEEEVKKQSYILDNCTIKKDWVSGTIPVPFKAGKGGTIVMGGLASEAEISRTSYVRGELSTMKEAYGSLIVSEKDIMLNGKISEQSFIKILPDQLEDLRDVYTQSVSTQVLNGGALTVVSANGDASGNVSVSHPERLTIGQRLTFKGVGESATGYVKTIDVNTGAILLVTAPAGSTGCVLNADGGDASQADIDAGDLVYLSNGDSHNFTDVSSMLLPSGIHSAPATLFGQTKASYPFLQTTYKDGDSTCVSAAGLLGELFDTQGKAQKRGANPKEWILSYTNYLAIKKYIETTAGTSYRIIDSGKDTVNYAGTKKIVIGGIDDETTIRAVRDMPDYLTLCWDVKDLEFHCPPTGFFHVLETPEGNKYYTVRTAGTGTDAGYKYISDIVLRGEFIHTKPWNTAVIYRTVSSKNLVSA